MLFWMQQQESMKGRDTACLFTSVKDPLEGKHSQVEEIWGNRGRDVCEEMSSVRTAVEAMARQWSRRPFTGREGEIIFLMARGGAPRGGRREPGGRGAGAPERVEEDSDAETYGEENEEQGYYSKRKVVSNWDRYQDIEKEVDREGGESQRGTDFSVLLSSAGDSFSQFRFAEEKAWDGEASCPKQNSALYVDCESLVQALQELPLSVRLNVAAELVQTTLPSELPQVKPKRRDEGQGPGMQLKGPLGPGGKGAVSELRAAGCPRPALAEGSQKPAPPPSPVAGHLEEELDLLLTLNSPVKEEENISPAQIPRDLESEKDGELAQEEAVPAKPSVTAEEKVESEHPSTSKDVTEEELEDWLDSMIS
ncbi:cell death regulator Aven [Talpa occidentalis]|uniref:cell death regulator Aven n=1 Tax=Talpa occidentalis TaxID=50954 RepID=UPI0023F7A317|nr:cell death regulator Aven [Talpa occidentalis]